MQILVKRAKIFQRTVGNVHQTVRVTPGQPTVVPDWVRNELGFKLGLKDGSIMDIAVRVANAQVQERPAAVEEGNVALVSEASASNNDPLKILEEDSEDTTSQLLKSPNVGLIASAAIKTANPQGGGKKKGK